MINYIMCLVKEKPPAPDRNLRQVVIDALSEALVEVHIFERIGAAVYGN